HGTAHARWYRIIAEHYDRLYDPRRVTRASAFLRYLFHRHAIGRDVLDVACGTFAIDLPLVKRGYQVVGRDRSEAMIRVARRNLQTAGVTADVDRAEMQSLHLGRRFDALLCLGPSSKGDTELTLALTKRLCAFGRRRSLLGHSARRGSDRSSGGATFGLGRSMNGPKARGSCPFPARASIQCCNASAGPV